MTQKAESAESYQQNKSIKMKRPKVTAYIATSVDGYIARSDGSLDWLEKLPGTPAEYGFTDHYANIDAIILGRNTYETIINFPQWPYSDKRVIVLSNTKTGPVNFAKIYSGDLNKLLSNLFSDGIKHIWVDGGKTITSFLEQQLVDRLVISIIPVILGSGIPLFGKIKQEINSKLIASQSYNSGLVQNTYEIHYS